VKFEQKKTQGWYLPELFQIVQAGDNANGPASGLKFELARYRAGCRSG
jgi:hypothetical protein